MTFRFVSSLALLFLIACQSDVENTDLSTSVPPLALQNPNWVALKGGCFEMGEARVYREETPVTEVCLDPFEIWSHEVSNAEYAAFVNETGHKTRAEMGWKADEADGPGVDMTPSSAVFVPPKNPQGLNWWRLIEGASWKRPLGPNKQGFKGDSPVVHITREDAERYAIWAGGRLPTEAEWEYAARGGLDGTLMSWEEAEGLALEDRANTWQGVFPVINSEDDGYAGIAPIGQYPANGFGLHDMIGNVWEWTSSSYYPTHSPGDAVKQYPKGYDPAQGNVPVGVVKGGSFLCARSYCYRYRPAARQGQDLIFGTSHIGFRIVRDVANE